MTEEQPPNTNLHCNLCGEKITSICMLSPDWSTEQQWKGILPSLREHLKKEHGVDPPSR